MDDFQVIIYIIIVVILFISRVMKARKKADQPVPPPLKRFKETEVYQDPAPETYNAPPPPRQLTFEDLLKEFSGYGEKQKDFAPAEEDTYEIPPRPEQKPEKPAYDSYESPDRYPIHNYEQASSLESLVSYEDIYKSAGTVNKTDVKPFDINENRFNEYTAYKSFDIHKANRFKRLLRNSTYIKDAVILKEIFDRKYF